jgi:hypothetical protein
MSKRNQKEKNQKKVETEAEKYGEAPQNIKNWVDFVRMRFEAMAKAKEPIMRKFQKCLLIRDFGLDAYKNHDDPYNQKYRSARSEELVQAWIDEISENMPEVNLVAADFRDRDAQEKARGKERALASIDEETGANGEKLKRTDDVAALGTGILHERWNPDFLNTDGEKGNLESIRIDPRYFFIDEAATDIKNARDCLLRDRMTLSEFMEKYEDFDISEVKFGKMQNGTPKKAQDGNSLHFFTRDEAEAGKNDLNTEFFVIVYDYWSKSLGKRFVIANNSIVHFEEISDLDFSVDYYLKRNDSFWGIGIIEKCAPEIFALDVFTELAFKNGKMALEPMIVGDGGVGFHTGLKTAPGTMIALSDIGDRNIRDTFAEIRLGGIPGEFFNFREILQDDLTTSSQIDQRALMANPNQLATQTRAKKESFQKRGRSILRRTLWESERRRMKIRVRLFDKYIAPLSRNFLVNGYFVIRGESENPTFLKDSAARGNFRATTKNTKVKVSISVSDSQKKANLDKEARDQILTAMNFTANLKQIDPEEGKKINVLGMAEMLFENLGLEKSRILEEYSGRGIDEIQKEHKRMAFGAKVSVPNEEDFETSEIHLEEHRRFLHENPKLSSGTKRIIIEHIEETAKRMLYDENGERKEVESAALMPSKS